MKLSNLEVRNFRIFDECSLSFEAPVTVLVGMNNTGKSTLLDAICFACLGFCRGTGADGRGADILARLGADPATMNVNVSFDGRVLSRGIADTTRSAKGKEIAKKLGVSADVAMVCLAWEALLEMDPAEARRVFLEVLGVEVTAEAILEVVGKEAFAEIGHMKFSGPDSLEAAYKSVYAQRAEVNRAMKGLNLPDLSAFPKQIQDMTLAEAKAELPDMRELLTALEGELEQKVSDTSRAAGQKAAGVAAMRAELRALKERIVKAKADLDALKPDAIKSLQTGLKNALKAAEKAHESQAKLRERIAAEQALHEVIYVRQKSLGIAQGGGGQAGMCPTCASRLTADQLKKLVEATKLDLEASETRLEDHQAKLREIDIPTIQKNIEAHQKALDAAQADTIKQKQIEETLHDCGSAVASITKQLTQAGEPVEAPEQASLMDAPQEDPEVEAVRSRITNGRKMIATVERYIQERAAYERVKKEAAGAEAHQARLDKLVKALDPKGEVATRCILAKISPFEKAVNDVLKVFGYEARVSITGGFDIQVRKGEEGGWLPMRMLSVSERLRLGVAIQSAFAVRSGFGIILVDETSQLDTVNTDHLVQAVADARAAGVEQIILAGTMKSSPKGYAAPEIEGWKFEVL